MTGEVLRMKGSYEKEREKRRRTETEKKEVSRELKEAIKSYSSAQMEHAKLVKEKEHLLKQI
jgi:DNA-binding transcriptional regulator YhcF (GntR family)